VIRLGKKPKEKDLTTDLGVCRDFIFVDRRFEISNLSFIRDKVELVELAEA